MLTKYGCKSGTRGHGRGEGRDFSPEKCLEDSDCLVSHVGFYSKLQFRSTLFVFEMNQNCSFVQFVSGPNLQFCIELKCGLSN